MDSKVILGGGNSVWKTPQRLYILWKGTALRLKQPSCNALNVYRRNLFFHFLKEKPDGHVSTIFTRQNKVHGVIALASVSFNGVK